MHADEELLEVESPVERARVTAEGVGRRVDRFLQSCLPEETRSAVQRLIAEGHVRLNGAPVKAGSKLRLGDEVSWTVPRREPSTLAPERIPLAVVYEDDDLVVVDKPKGMVVHPAPGNWSGTLVNALLARYGTRL